MTRRININELCYMGGERHTWEAGGLDFHEGVLVNTRECLRCDARQVKPYGHKGAWQDRTDQARW